MNTPVKCSVTALIVVRSAFKLGVWEGAFAGARDLGEESTGWRKCWSLQCWLGNARAAACRFASGQARLAAKLALCMCGAPLGSRGVRYYCLAGSPESLFATCRCAH